MKKQISLIIIIAIITTIVISVLSFSEEIDNYIDENDDDKWIHSGPFAIDREEYLLGHKIFLIVRGIEIDDKGSINLTKINEDGTKSKITKYPFDGKKGTEFNIYFTPSLNIANEICSVEDVVGNYEVVFEGTNYKSIKLKILNQYLTGFENRYDPIC